MSLASTIKINLEVIQPDWEQVYEFLKKHKGCDPPTKMWFHSVPQCNGKFKLYIQLYCDKCFSKLIPFSFQSSTPKVKNNE